MTDLRFGVIAATIANVHGNKKKASDFFTSLRRQPSQAHGSSSRMVRMFEHMTAAFGGVDARERKGSDGTDSH